MDALITWLENISPLTLALIMLWVLPWKGVALWKAARLYHKWWFIVFLVVNALAIPEILYIFFVARPAERALAEEDENSDNQGA